MTFRLAPGTEDLVSQIADIWEAGWHEAHADIVPDDLRALRTPASFLDRTSDNLAATRVACDASGVLGFCMVKADELYQMYVSPRARGTGVAKALIDDAEDRIQAQGNTQAWLACAVGNTRALRFYEKNGWINSGRHTIDLDTSDGPYPLEVWRMAKSLARPIDTS